MIRLNCGVIEDKDTLSRIPTRSRNSRPKPSRLDPEMVEPGLQSRALHAQPRGCAVGSSKLSAAIPKGAKNAFAFLIAEIDLLAAVALGGLFQFRQRRLQNRSRRQNDRALHEVLQFANVTRPIPPHQSFHGFRRNAGDGFFHLSRELTDE